MNLSFAKKHPELAFIPILLHMVPKYPGTDEPDFASASASMEDSLSNMLLYANESSKPIIISADQYLLLLTEENFAGSSIILRHLKLLNRFYESHFQIHLDLFWGYACFYEQLVIQCRYLSKQASISRRDMPLNHRQFIVHETIEYLLEDPAQSCEELADKLVLHPNYLKDVFQKETGQSLHDFITMLRINQAKKVKRSGLH